MSHFTVLIIGDDYETQLAPYHEFECTGVDDEYVQTIDDTETTRASYGDGEDYRNYPTFADYLEGYYGRGILLEGETPDLKGEHKFGYTVINSDGEVIATYNRTNPNAKWDWYAVGGRWSGFFKLKEGTKGLPSPPLLLNAPPESGYANRARLCDIDIEGMRNQAETQARVTFAMWRECFEGSDTLPESWPTIRERFKGDVEKARKVYHAQPAIKASLKLRLSLLTDPVEEFGFDEEEYVARQRANALSTFAVVKEGKWYQRGDMGWWGIVSNETDSEDWLQQFNRHLDNLDPETVLTIVDCHI